MMLIRRRSRFCGNEAPKDFNIAGEVLKDVAVQNPIKGERVF